MYQGTIGVDRDFSSWIKRQLERAKLMEGRDFIISIEKGEYRKPLTEYFLTLDSAKHIAVGINGMVAHESPIYLRCGKGCDPLAPLAETKRWR
jgi:phage anti-repressor protein